MEGLSTLRLYAKQKEGGRGLVSVGDIIQDETTKIQEYIRKIAPNDDLLNECLMWQGPSRTDKPLHRMYHRQIEDRECWSQGQQRDTDHGSTGTGLEQKIV